MKHLFEEYGGFIQYIVIALVIMSVLFGSFFLYWKSNQVKDVNAMTDATAFVHKEKPLITATDKKIKKNTTFNVLEGVTATDTTDGNITSSIQVKELEGGRLTKEKNTYVFDTSHSGYSLVQYVVENSKGIKTKKRIVVIIDN